MLIMGLMLTLTTTVGQDCKISYQVDANGEVRNDNCNGFRNNGLVGMSFLLSSAVPQSP